MKKLILNTSVITFFVILIVSALSYLFVALIFPKSLAKVYSELGAEKLAVVFYEKQYNKSKDFNDLVALCDKLDSKTDSEKTEKYIFILLKEDDFVTYCENSDKKRKGSVSSLEYYYGKLAVSLYINEGLNGAMDICDSYIENYGKTKFNPYVIISVDETISLTEEERQIINNKIN